MARRFGFECEVSARAEDALAALYDQGLAADTELHAYHCDCSDCDYWSSWPVRGQEDCTVDGELISKVLVYGSTEADRTIRAVASALQAVGAVVRTNAGFHVHVDATDLDVADRLRVCRLFARHQHDLAELADATFGAVRSYNTPVLNSAWMENAFWNETLSHGQIAELFQKGHWLAWAPDTFEFRLWNATRSAWRMRLAVGVSVAIVDAAADGVSVTPATSATLLEVLAPYLDAATLGAVVRHAFYTVDRTRMPPTTSGMYGSCGRGCGLACRSADARPFFDELHELAVCAERAAVLRQQRRPVVPIAA